MCLCYSTRPKRYSNLELSFNSEPEGNKTVTEFSQQIFGSLESYRFIRYIRLQGTRYKQTRYKQTRYKQSILT